MSQCTVRKGREMEGPSVFNSEGNPKAGSSQCSTLTYGREGMEGTDGTWEESAQDRGEMAWMAGERHWAEHVPRG